MAGKFEEENRSSGNLFHQCDTVSRNSVLVKANLQKFGGINLDGNFLQFHAKYGCVRTRMHFIGGF